MEYIIKDRDSFDKLRNDKNFSNSIRKIKLEIGENTISERYERILNKTYFACGCQEGAMAVYATLFICIIVWLAGDFAIMQNWWTIFIAMAISAVVGKITGIIVSRYRLKKALEDLGNYIEKLGL